jgi:hypothetical protein
MTSKRKGARAGASKTRSAKARAAMPRVDYGGGWSVASDPALPIPERAGALRRLAISVCDDPAEFKRMLKLVRDSSEPPPVRLAAIEALQASSFQELKFKPYRAAYVAALRAVATDPDFHIRRRVLGFLMRGKDGYAQKLLLGGLRNPEKALLPPEKALQLLGYDMHAEVYELARAMVKKPPNEAAKVEALRLLAADAKSAPVFAKILRDKGESTRARQVSASALHTLAPQALQEHAREIVLDEAENEEMKATSLTALTHFGDEDAVAKDKTLRKRVDRLKKSGKSKSVKESAKRFQGRYGE